MSSTSASSGSASAKKVTTIVLGVIGVLLVILGIVYLAVPAKSLPGVMGYHNNSGTDTVRMAASFVVGVVCLVAAALTARTKKS